MRPRILIVEDDEEWIEIYRRCLRDSDFEVTAVKRVATALALLEEQSFDVLINDLKMLGGPDEFSGFHVLERARTSNPDTQIIVITGYGTEDHAVRVMGSGCYAYLTKDRDLRNNLAIAVRGALELRLLKKDLLYEESKDDVLSQSDRIVGNSASMQEVFERIAYAASSDANTLIFGEPGTGKRLIAQTLHRQSSRKTKPFLVIDCSHLSENELVNELFGREDRSTTGGGGLYLGKFERARGGTVLIDGINELEARLQNRILPALSEKSIGRIGGDRRITLDVRIVVTSEKDLASMVAAGQFKRQLFHAINEFFIYVPPLRDRRDGDDIPALAAMFVSRHSKRQGLQLSPEALALLRVYDYPGNVRELESAIKYSLTLSSGDVILPQHLRPEIRSHSGPAVEKLGAEKDFILGKLSKTPINTNSVVVATSGRIAVLFLAAEPNDAMRLRLAEEIREIQEKLQLGKMRERFSLEQRMSLRPTDLSQALLDLQPNIVHFSGHGTPSGALCLENQEGHTHPVPPDALAALFEQFSNQIDCVLLNACYSESQATAIAQYVKYVIGMKQEIGDRAAIAFSVGFYQALGAGRNIEDSYKLGCVQIRLRGIPEHATPVLIRNPDS